MKKYLDFFFQKLKDTLKDLWRQNSRFGDVMPHPIHGGTQNHFTQEGMVLELFLWEQIFLIPVHEQMSFNKKYQNEYTDLLCRVYIVPK